MTANVSVTVLMPVYNGERYLREAVESVLSQTYTDFEFLIIDDGSCDRTGDILASYHDPRIRLIRNTVNLGMTTSLNKGLELARGKYIARMDCDDISLPQRLSRQVAFMEMHPEVGLCGSWAKTTGQASKDLWRYPVDPEVIKCTLLFSSILVHPSVMFRRELFLKAGLLYNVNFKRAQDYELWVRAARHTVVTNIGEVLLYYRLHPEQVGRQHRENQKHAAGLIHLEQLRELGIDPSPEELAVHQAVSQYELKPDKDFVNRADAWFKKLRRVNQVSEVYPEPAFSAVLALRWVYVCNAARSLGLWTVWRFLQSPLRRYYPRTVRDYLLLSLRGHGS